MKVKLKIIDELIEEFGFKYISNYYHTFHKGRYNWYIFDRFLGLFGKEVEVRIINNPNYTHLGPNFINLHKSWFVKEVVVEKKTKMGDMPYV